MENEQRNTTCTSTIVVVIVCSGGPATLFLIQVPPNASYLITSPRKIEGSGSESRPNFRSIAPSIASNEAPSDCILNSHYKFLSSCCRAEKNNS